MPRGSPSKSEDPNRLTASGIALVPPDASGEPIRRALAAIDRVHAMPNAPTIPIRRRSLSEGDDGHYDPRLGEIVIALDAAAPEATTVHEFGHFLDHRIFGATGRLGRSLWGSEHAAEFDDWRAIVDTSQASRSLYRVLTTVPNPDMIDYAQYLLRTRELWARSYEQYIATRSADPTLIAQIVAVRTASRRPTLVRFDYYWSDAGFAPIAAAIDKLFAARGWNRGTDEANP